MVELLTTFEGRIGRGRFWLGVLAIFVGAIILSFILVPIFGATSFLGRTVQLVLGLALLYPFAAIATKRLHDRGKPQMPWLAIFIGPGALLNIMQSLGIGFTTMQLVEPTSQLQMQVQVPNALGYIVMIASMIVGIWALVELGFLRGTRGDNDYGPDPVAQG